MEDYAQLTTVTELAVCNMLIASRLQVMTPAKKNGNQQINSGIIKLAFFIETAVSLTGHIV